jgi:hypothetical protein
LFLLLFRKYQLSKVRALNDFPERLNEITESGAAGILQVGQRRQPQ